MFPTFSIMRCYIMLVPQTDEKQEGGRKKRLYRNQSLQRNIIETETQVIVGHVLCFGLVLVTMRKILGKAQIMARIQDLVQITFLFQAN